MWGDSALISGPVSKFSEKQRPETHCSKTACPELRWADDLLQSKIDLDDPPAQLALPTGDSSNKEQFLPRAGLLGLNGRC